MVFKLWGTHKGAPYVSRGIASWVRSVTVGGVENRVLSLGVTRPGMHSLWYALDRGTVYFNEHRWPLMRLLKASNSKAQTKQVEAGQVILTDGHSVMPVEAQAKVTVTSKVDLTLDQAVPEFMDLFIEATREIYIAAGRPKIMTMLSGGTDSTLGTIALREIGADIHAVCVGRTPDDFDARYAADYARQLAIPYTFIPLPTDTADLNALAYEAIAASEMSEMSNTLMAMCTTLARRWAEANDRPCIWKGHFADDMLGTNNATYGTFKKKFPAQTDQEWSDYRCAMYQHIIPNNTQVAQVCRRGETFWRSTFFHPSVSEYVWAAPIAVVPLRLRKPLFGGACELYLTDCSWNLEEKKVGYYTGSGIGKIRLENPVLGDDNFRRLYRIAKEQLS